MATKRKTKTPPVGNEPSNAQIAAMITDLQNQLARTSNVALVAQPQFTAEELANMEPKDNPSHPAFIRRMPDSADGSSKHMVEASRGEVIPFYNRPQLPVETLTIIRDEKAA